MTTVAVANTTSFHRVSYLNRVLDVRRTTLLRVHGRSAGDSEPHCRAFGDLAMFVGIQLLIQGLK